jgi:hypothetical protein
MNSSDEEHGDKLEGIYVRPIKTPVLLSQSEAAIQRAAGSALKNAQEEQRMRAELDACDQGSVQGRMDTCVPQRHPSET